MNQTFLRRAAYDVETAAYDDVETGAQFPLKNDGLSKAVAVAEGLLGELAELIRCEMAENFCLGQKPLERLKIERARWQLCW